MNSWWEIASVACVLIPLGWASSREGSAASRAFKRAYLHAERLMLKYKLLLLGYETHEMGRNCQREIAAAEARIREIDRQLS